MVVDAAVTTVYRNTGIHRVTSIPGYAAKQAEDRNLLADRTSALTIASIHGGPLFLIPFAIKDGGRLGARALALLKALTIFALEKGRRPLFAYRAHAAFAPTLDSL